VRYAHRRPVPTPGGADRVARPAASQGAPVTDSRPFQPRPTDQPAFEVAEVAEVAEAGEFGSWQDQALCAQTDPEAFFPEKGGSTREAKRICLGCDVKQECLDHALAHDERFGIWGGLSERERRRLRREAV